MHERIIVRNFTAFTDLDLEFVPGLNILVGANSTGKTHMMKLLYAMQSVQSLPVPSVPGQGLTAKLQAVFKPDTIGRLAHRQRGKVNVSVCAQWAGKPYSFTLVSDAVQASESGGWKNVSRPVYIPVQDMLAHSVGFRSLYSQRVVDYEDVYADILDLAFLPALRGAPTYERADLLESLRQHIHGRVHSKGERFYVKMRAGDLEMPLVAEGYRKLALLWLLVQNGSLDAAHVLFWDEPEANLNPSLLREVVGTLLRLTRMGVQVFIATHSYVLLKEVDLQRASQDEVRLYALAPDRSGAVQASPADDYAGLEPNLIASEFDRIYTEELRQAVRGS